MYRELEKRNGTSLSTSSDGSLDKIGPQIKDQKGDYLMIKLLFVAVIIPIVIFGVYFTFKWLKKKYKIKESSLKVRGKSFILLKLI